MDNSLPDALRQMIKRKALLIFSAADDDSPVSRCANTLDASSTVGSFIMTNACKGVFVFKRFTSHWSRLLASNIAIDGGGTVNLINVYIPLLYNASPSSCLSVANTPRPDV